jgi:hypothetical protein
MRIRPESDIDPTTSGHDPAADTPADTADIERSPVDTKRITRIFQVLLPLEVEATSVDEAVDIYCRLIGLRRQSVGYSFTVINPTTSDIDTTS